MENLRKFYQKHIIYLLKDIQINVNYHAAVLNELEQNLKILTRPNIIIDGKYQLLEELCKALHT